MDPGEMCDDGNSVSLDGCSSICESEPGFTCSGFGVGTCVPDPVCGNLLIETPSENCEDGNGNPGDGCSNC